MPHLLTHDHSGELFEAKTAAGGHARTVVRIRARSSATVEHPDALPHVRFAAGGFLNLYKLIFPWLPGVMRAVYRMEVTGTELVPQDGGLVVVANHLSALDPFVLGAAVPRPLRFMSKEELWRWRPIGWAVEGFGGFPVGRGRGDRSAIDTGVRIVEAGEAVAIFPGGSVRNDGPWFRGAAKIALLAGVPVLPVRLLDSDRALAGRRVRFPSLHVTIGPPIAVERAKPTIASARELTERMRATVDALATA